MAGKGQPSCGHCLGTAFDAAAGHGTASEIHVARSGSPRTQSASEADRPRQEHAASRSICGRRRREADTDRSSRHRRGASCDPRHASDCKHELDGEEDTDAARLHVRSNGRFARSAAGTRDRRDAGQLRFAVPLVAGHQSVCRPTCRTFGCVAEHQHLADSGAADGPAGRSLETQVAARATRRIGHRKQQPTRRPVRRNKSQVVARHILSPNRIRPYPP